MPLSSKSAHTLIVSAFIGCVVIAAAFAYSFYRGGKMPFGGNSEQESLLDNLPADAPVLAYIDVATLRKSQNSALAAILSLASVAPAEDPEYLEFVAGTGFDYKRDLDKIAIAFWPAAEPSAPNSHQNRSLAIADGRFDAQKIKAYAVRTGALTTHGTSSIYRLPGNPPVAFEFLSPGRIALASGDIADDLLDASDSRNNNTALQARIQRISNTAIFVVAGAESLPAGLYLNLLRSPQLKSLAGSVQNLTLAGQPDGDEIEATVDLQCDSATNALKLETLLEGARILGSVALADPKTRRQMTDEEFALANALLEKAKISESDASVRLELAITPEMISGSPVPPHR